MNHYRHHQQTHPIVSTTNQKNGKHTPSFTAITLRCILRISNMPTTIVILTMKTTMMIMITIMIVLVAAKLNLLGTSNMPTTIMRHLVRGFHPGSSAVPTEHYFLSSVTAIPRRYWIHHAWISKIFCSRKANVVPDAFSDVYSIHTRCTRTSSTTGTEGT